MKDKFFIWLIIAPFLILFLTLGAVEVVSITIAKNMPKSQLPQDSVSLVANTQASPLSPANQAANAVPWSAPPDKNALHDSEVQSLAEAVHIATGSKIPTPDKKVWATQLQIAEKLSQKMCNCEQRNWLNRFIMTANDAISGSDNYYQSAEILSSLPHNNQEFAAGVPSPRH